jgi:hypothetical protein
MLTKFIPFLIPGNPPSNLLTNTYISMKKNYLLNMAMIIAVLFSSVQPIHAQKAWGYVAYDGGSSMTAGNIYEFNLNTGAETLLGSVSCVGGNSLFAGEFINGTFYALENTGSNLVSISNNGTCSQVNPLTGIIGGQTVTGLSHNMANGITYVTTTDCSTTELYSLNLANGILTHIGSINAICGIALMIDHTGNAYVIDILTDQIHSLNLSTAAIGSGVGITKNGNPMDLNFAQDADFGCTPNGDIVGMLYDANSGGSLGGLNPTTGVFTETNNILAEVSAFSIDCSVPACPSPFTVTLTPKGVNTNKWGPAPSDPYTFYHGLSQWKKIKSTVTGGVGPFTYVWGNIGSGQIKNVGSKIDQKFLYQPTGATKVYLNVTDQSTNCTFGDTIDIHWNDDFFCGTMTPYIHYKLLICENGVTKCETWRNGFNKIKAGHATLGACTDPRKRADEIQVGELDVFPNPVADVLNISVPGDAGQIAKVVLLNASGQVMLVQDIQATGSEVDATIDMQQFSSGLYLLNVEMEGKVYSEKVQVIK